MKTSIKVLLVEDSSLMRILLSEKLRTADQIELVGIAKNGQEGTLMAKKLNPDVIVTDMLMSDYDGLYLVKHIMKDKPTPIIVLSSMDKSNIQIFEALNLGAIDFVAKGGSGKIASKFIPNLIKKIKIASGVNLSSENHPKKNHNNHNHSFNTDLFYEAVVMGASTGGPSALESILSNLPSNFALPVIIAQHMPPLFIQSFVKRLKTNLPLNICIAKKGEAVKPGVVYFVPGKNTYLKRETLTDKVTFQFTDTQYKHFNDPSIDCLFESAAKCYKNRVFSVLLTGMGKDGVKGMKDLYNCGAYTVAQDERSSVVYGMPKAAIEEGVVKRVVGLADIPAFTVSCCDR